MNATYSPDDNKLRLYAETRLDAETYARVRAAGFIWAPKQDLFVAPMWTPEREDLLIALCGEVGDEDTSLVDRAEERAERFQDYSAARADDAEQAHNAVSAITDGIPLGQPILVGHHSERHARKDAERIENGMRRAVKMWECSKYWKARAAGALHHAKYKELPSVRARRIKTIEAAKRKEERDRATADLCFRFWKGELNYTNNATGEKKPLLMTEENKERICRLVGNSADGFGRLPVATKEGSSGAWDRWGAWDVLQPDGQRYGACPSCTVAQCVEAAHRHYPAMLERCDRWIAHYENRLAYERALLAEAGGIATDKNAPEKGGACRCWVSHRGGMSYIVKVNRVSVSVLDNWGNGGRNFTRTVPFDKIADVWSAAKVEEMRKAGRLVEYADKTGFAVLADTPAPAPTVKAEPPKSEQETKMQGLADTLKQGVQVVSAPQLFPTPHDLAKRLVELAEIDPAHRILEPSAGTGNLLLALHESVPLSAWPSLKVTAVEINSALAAKLNRFTNDVRRTDFLECNGDLGTFDRIIMNPPFANGSDIKHIQHALTMLRPNGRLVAICANGPRQREQLQPLAEQWIELGPEVFRDQGANVNTALLVITK